MGHQRSSPYVLNLQRKNQACFTSSNQVKQSKEEGSYPPSSEKVMVKMCIGRIPKPYPNMTTLSYIPFWVEVEGMRHMTEGRHGDGFLAPRGPDEVQIFYTCTSRGS
jgi:hypothetical protein